VRALGCPSDADLKTVIRLNVIKDCPVVQDDIVLAEKIFGKDIVILKGKTTRKNPIPVVNDTIAVPKGLKGAQKDVTICIDTFFANKMSFLHTIWERIHYRTSQWIPDRETSRYQEYLTVVFKLYIKARFNIKYVCMDQEFDRVLSKMKDEFKFMLNIAAAQEHVPDVERSIRVVKERCRAVFHANLFKSLPRVLMKVVVQECTKKLIFFRLKAVFPKYIHQGRSAWSEFVV
jgi:hypothetical protein